MLHGTTDALPPFWRISRATASQASAFRLEITTAAPSSAIASALARPMPRLEPVMIATVPSRANGDAGAPTRPSTILALPIGLREILAQLLLGDSLAMDLVRAIGEAQHAGARICISQVKILADAAAAAHLDGSVNDLLGHVGGHHLDHGNLGTCGLVADRIHHVRGVQGEQTRLVDLDAGLRNPVACHAVVRNGPAEGTAADGALAHGFQRALGDADEPHAVMDAAWAEPSLRDLEAPTFAEEYVRSRHPHVLEYNFRVAVRRVVVSEDAQRTLDLHARCVERHQHHGLAAMGLGLR